MTLNFHNYLERPEHYHENFNNQFYFDLICFDIQNVPFNKDSSKSKMEKNDREYLLLQSKLGYPFACLFGTSSNRINNNKQCFRIFLFYFLFCFSHQIRVLRIGKVDCLLNNKIYLSSPPFSSLSMI